jgi:hypothetical protein
MGRKAEKFELNDISGDAPNHVSHFLSASKARKYRCITSAIIAVFVVTARDRARTCSLPVGRGGAGASSGVVAA